MLTGHAAYTCLGHATRISTTDAYMTQALSLLGTDLHLMGRALVIIACCWACSLYLLDMQSSSGGRTCRGLVYEAAQ